jgi:hypothetical protein
MTSSSHGQYRFEEAKGIPNKVVQREAPLAGGLAKITMLLLGYFPLRRDAYSRRSGCIEKDAR